MDIHVENYKSVFQAIVVLVILFKIHVIDRKLSLLEKKFVDK